MFKTLKASSFLKNQILSQIKGVFTPMDNVLDFIRIVLDPIQKTLDSIQPVFDEIKAIDLLAKKQFVFWEYLNQDLAIDICKEKNLESFMLEYYTKNNSKRIDYNIGYSKNHRLMNLYKNLSYQSISTYKRGEYYISILGLLAISDGLLSEVSNLKTNTNIKKRGEVILKKIEKDKELVEDDYATINLYITFKKTLETIG